MMAPMQAPHHPRVSAPTPPMTRLLVLGAVAGVLAVAVPALIAVAAAVEFTAAARRTFGGDRG